MYQKKYFFLLLFFFLSFGIFFSPHSATSAGLQYTLLEKIPGFASTNGSDLPAYIIAIYKLGLAVVTLSAVLMISIGGFLYLTSAGNTSSMGTAKGIIFDAVIGLVIALSSWVLLNVINPDLTTITLTPITTGIASVTPSVTIPAGGLTPATGNSQDLAKQILALKVTQESGECSSTTQRVTPKSNIQSIADGKAMSVCSHTCKSVRPHSSGCTDNAVNANETMLRAIATIKPTLNFTITSIAGGAHAQNSDHYKGNAIDIFPATQALLDAFIANGAVKDNGDRSGSFCEARNGSRVTCPGGADHIHIKF